MALTGENTSVAVDGHRIRLTNLDKVMYPKTGTTKRDVIFYYAQIAPYFIPHATGRPATRKRWVNGVGTDADPGSVFFEKNLGGGTPQWVRREGIEHSSRTAYYPLVDDPATLVWLAQIAALEIHVPQWRFGPRGGIHRPDRLVLDLDPGEGAGLPECIEVALLCKEILDDISMPSIPVTSGSKGIHLYAALDGKRTSDQISAFAKELARALEADHPDLVVSDMTKAKRGGKVLVDWSQNNGKKTTIAPYSLRGRDRPMVAVPRNWDELNADLRQLDFEETLARVDEIGDPMAAIEPPEEDRPDRLATYRSMRDATKTPEPVPASTAPASDDRSFVIQEHHARRLHYDLRLERDGVLASWAIPKGPPTDSGENHLAVQTEDHPMEYATFEGDIPKGEYGAGHMRIWDHGTFELEKWREGKEVIVTLHGQPDGGLQVPRRYALINTKLGGDPKNWLIHLMDDQPEGVDAPPDKPKRSAKRYGPSAPRARKLGLGAERNKAPRLPKFADIAPMLASAGTVADLRGDDWIYEVKWDGYRAITTLADGELFLRSRRGIDLLPTFGEVAELKDLIDGHDVVLDGEIVALDSTGRPNFQLLQGRSRSESTAKVQLMLFDILHLDGQSLLHKPYEERREILEEIVQGGTTVHVPPTFGDDQDTAISMSKKLKLEGVMAKRSGSIYQPGRRAHTWVKIKHQRAQEVAVVGWRPGQGNRAGTIGSLLVAVPVEGELVYAGRVGSGFTDRELAETAARLRKIERRTPQVSEVPPEDARDAHWVTPVYVGEVTFAEWSNDNRLRQAVWRGWRPDKTVSDLRRE